LILGADAFLVQLMVCAALLSFPGDPSHECPNDQRTDHRSDERTDQL
jgi:hypothetical protein